MSEKEVEDFRCYECLCLAACKGKTLVVIYKKCYWFACFVHNNTFKNRQILYRFLNVSTSGCLDDL
jgi:hypothetical protein